MPMSPFLTFLCAAALTWPLSAPGAEPGKGADGKPTHPALAVSTVDGATFDLAAHRGEWVVVNFWATWCAPCLKEIPDLSAFDAEREDVTVIGLAYDEIEVDDLRAFLKKHPAGYAIAIVDVYAPPKDFETPRGLPMTYLIAPDGSVARKFLGPVTAKELAATIAAAAKPAAKPTGP
jgi:thiol-disulfide isomerase/thioredoxin